MLRRTSRRQTLILWDIPALEWAPVVDLRLVYWQRWDRVHRRGQPPTEAYHEGMALTTADARWSAETIYTIMQHRWEEENCVFRRGQSAWPLAHRCGHTAARVEALTALQFGARTLWTWWSYRLRAAAPRAGPVPECARLEAARGAVGHLRTHWTTAFGAACGTATVCPVDGRSGPLASLPVELT